MHNIAQGEFSGNYFFLQIQFMFFQLVIRNQARENPSIELGPEFKKVKSNISINFVLGGEYEFDIPTLLHKLATS